MPMMGLREYSRHRGCTLHAVQTAIAHGRIQKVDGKIDSEAADKAWEENTDAAMARYRGSNQAENASSKTAAYLEERTLRERLRRQREQMELDQQAGLLVPKAEVLHGYEAAFTRTRAKFLGVPSKVKQHLPHLTSKDLVVIDQIVRDALSELANVDSEE